MNIHQTYISNDGKEIIIRKAQTSDAKAMIDCVKSYVGDEQFIPFTVGEFNPSEEDEKIWIESFSKQDNSILLVATHQDKIIGNIGIVGGSRVMTQHTGQIGMGITPFWQSKGVGSALIYTLIQWAKSTNILEILCLEVFSTNEKGLNLYKKYGFVESGKREKLFKTTSNTYIDEVIMTLELNKINK